MYRCPRWSERKRSGRKWGRGASLQILVMYSITHGASDTTEKLESCFGGTGATAATRARGSNGELVSDLGWLVCEVISTPAG